MSAFKNSVEMWRLAGAGIGFRSRLLAFLCARFGNLSVRRPLLQKLLFNLIGFFAQNEQVKIRFRISSKPLVIHLRKANKSDYLVFGELVMGGYKMPGRQLLPPAAVIDGGANIGLFSLFAWATVPDIRVVCYEPDEANLAQLRLNLEANKITAEIIPKALWRETANLFYHPRESYSGFICAAPSPYPIACMLPVVPDDCWLKLDIEGGSMKFYQPCLKPAESPRLSAWRFMISTGVASSFLPCYRPTDMNGKNCSSPLISVSPSAPLSTGQAIDEAWNSNHRNQLLRTSLSRRA